ncbi:MAG: Sec-independent protein translocase subunit TatA/TatB [Alphaproteobacteria bacterium]
MFDVAWSELLLIAVVALFAIGPKELPDAMRKMAVLWARLQRVLRYARYQVDDFVHKAEEAHFRAEDTVKRETTRVATALEPDAIEDELLMKSTKSTPSAYQSQMHKPPASSAKEPIDEQY